MEKKRNYSKENKRQNEINDILKVKVKKEVSEQLKEKLKRENKTFSSFAREQIENYLKKN